MRWRTAGRIGLGWLFTLPAAGLVGAAAAFIAHLGTIGIVIDTVLGFGFILFIFWRSRRNRVDASNAIPVPDVAESGYAVRIRRGKVRQIATKTGTVPPLTPVAQSAVRSDKAVREAEKRAREAERARLEAEKAARKAERKAAEKAARKAAKRAQGERVSESRGDEGRQP